MGKTAKCRTISFKGEYMEAYDYLRSIPRASEYVCELIMRDIKIKRGDKAEMEKLANEMILMMNGIK